MNIQEIATRIDNTLLKPEADAAAIDKICDEAREHGFASVCVNGRYVERAAKRLRGSVVKTCAVAGFPLGAMTAEMIAAEAASLCEHGADEVDFVAALPDLMHKDSDALVVAWRSIVAAARGVKPEAVIKVILETAALVSGVSDAEGEARITCACDAARAAGVDFVKTSTGFHPAGGATVEVVHLMRKHGQGLRIKASGGIRNYQDAVRMLEAGADRLGCSAGVAIVTGGQGKAGY